jgi:hypothetical protein
MTGLNKGERMAIVRGILHVLVALIIASNASAASSDDRLATLERKLAALEHRLELQEDVEKVRVLAFSYAYYMDNVLYDQVKALLSKNIESCEISGYGVFLGHKGCVRMWTDLIGKPLGADKNQLAFGRIAKHYMLKDVITVAPDGNSAKGRFDYLSMGGAFGQPERTGSQIGIYNLSFLKEEGVWKISKFAVMFDTINYNQRDWATNPAIRCPNPAVAPDAPATPYHPFPETGVIPFHYPNPVTGQPIQQPITDTRYWIGNWPGEFGKKCGKREPGDPEPTAAASGDRGSTGSP